MMTETVVTVQQAPNNNATVGGGKMGGHAAGGEPQPALSWLKINVDYFKTVPGLLKLAQLILGILCMSLGSPAYRAGTHWFLFVVVISFIGTLIWTFVYLLGVREALRLPIDWLLSELANTGIFTILYIIAFIVQLTVRSVPSQAASLAAGVFGLINALAYIAGTYLLHIEWKNSRTN